MYDTIIIGAGLSGLAAGIRLAHFNQRVCILERHTTIGGLNSIYRCNGRNFDVGLHAVTNYAPPGTKRGPLAKLMRQLRLAWDELPLAPQVGSAVAFPGVTLRFSNDFALFEAEVERHFPGQIDGLRRLTGEILDYDRLTDPAGRQSAREVLGRLISEPILREMILCPLLFYGSARERDMDLWSFSIMFRAVFLEGFGRPTTGARLILKKLVRKYKELGGELRLRAGVDRLVVEDDTVTKILLDDGGELAARNVLSSAGWRETMSMCEPVTADAGPPAAGRVSYVESLSVLDRLPASLGLDKTIVFFNDSPEFSYCRPDDLVDLRSGIICSPSNFVYDQPPGEGVVRISSLANFERWAALDEPSYRLAKLRWYDRIVASAVRFVPDFRGAVVDTDMFTPTTIRRFTGKEEGAVYGSPEKKLDGTTHVKNLFLCGNDQGFVGIVGSILSGISIANQHLLRQ